MKVSQRLKDSFLSVLGSPELRDLMVSDLESLDSSNVAEDQAISEHREDVLCLANYLIKLEPNLVLKQDLMQIIKKVEELDNMKDNFQSFIQTYSQQMDNCALNSDLVQSINLLALNYDKLRIAVQNMASKLDIDAAAEVEAVTGSQLDIDYRAKLEIDLNPPPEE